MVTVQVRHIPQTKTLTRVVSQAMPCVFAVAGVLIGIEQGQRRQTGTGGRQAARSKGRLRGIFGLMAACSGFEDARLHENPVDLIVHATVHERLGWAEIRAQKQTGNNAPVLIV